MGSSSNTVSYVTYRVIDPGLGRDQLRENILRGLGTGRIKGIDVDLGNDRAAGFSLYEDPLSIEFGEHGVFFDPLVLFSFRMDKLVIPANTQRLYINRRVQERLNAQGREHMKREERQELADQVKLELLRKALPSITAVDVVWDMDRNTIRFYSTSAAQNEEFLEYFNQHMNIKIQAMNALGILESRLDERELSEIWHLLPTSFLLGGPVNMVRPDDQDFAGGPHTHESEVGEYVTDESGDEHGPEGEGETDNG